MSCDPTSSISADYRYVGDELTVFQHAVNWKRYFAAVLRPYIRGDVLEVGAGLGATTEVLARGDERTWTCLEPDPSLAKSLARHPRVLELGARASVVVATIHELPDTRAFDTILYVDVLEHIEQDHVELREAARRLKVGGHLLVLSPAHPWLFTPFDAAIGHFRRYDRISLRNCAPPDCTLKSLLYLDSLGLLASCGNRFALRSAKPSVRQILFWDRCLVPCSRIVDPLLGHRVGKTLVGIWQRTT